MGANDLNIEFSSLDSGGEKESKTAGDVPAPERDDGRKSDGCFVSRTTGVVLVIIAVAACVIVGVAVHYTSDAGDSQEQSGQPRQAGITDDEGQRGRQLCREACDVATNKLGQSFDM